MAEVKRAVNYSVDYAHKKLCDGFLIWQQPANFFLRIDLSMDAFLQVIMKNISIISLKRQGGVKLPFDAKQNKTHIGI